MKKIYLLMLVGLMKFGFCQVGINTTDPQATLDVNGNLIVRTVNPATAASTYDFLVTNNVTKEVEKVNGSFAGSNINTTIAKGEETDGITLLDGSLFAGWQKIDFASGNIPINVGGHFSAVTDFYTVPETGIYKIVYEFRYGDGITLSLLGNASIGILKHTGGSYTVLDQRKFSGVNVPMVLSLTISSSTINSVYQLNAGDQLSFEINDGGIALGLLSSSFAAFQVYKISD